MNLIGNCSFYWVVLQNTQKMKKEKQTTTLINCISVNCISDERYNLENLVKSDMDRQERI